MLSHCDMFIGHQPKASVFNHVVLFLFFFYFSYFSSKIDWTVAESPVLIKSIHDMIYALTEMALGSQLIVLTLSIH